MFYELTAREIPSLEYLFVDAKVIDDAVVKILSVSINLPGHKFGTWELTSMYADDTLNRQLRAWILEYHHENIGRIRQGMRENAGMDAAKEERDIA